MTHDDVITLAGDGAQTVVDAWDDDADRFALKTNGEFWYALQEARKEGLTGQGTRIAILDTCPDLTRGHLSDHMTLHSLGDGVPHAHGTAVALLINYIAPLAEIRHYDIAIGGQARRSLFAKAMKMLCDDPVDYVCLSLGDVQTMEEPDISHLAPHIRNDDLPGLAEAVAANPKPCPVVRQCFINPCTCKLVETVENAGAIVLTAAGNDNDETFCPARSPASIAVGFKSTVLSYKAGRMTKSWENPEGPQTSHVNWVVKQPPGVLGSSFAAPLLTGALALRQRGLPLHQLLAMQNMEYIVLLAQRLLDQHRQDTALAKKLKEQILIMCNHGLRRSGYYERLRLTPTQRLETSLFLSEPMVNFGVVLHEIGFRDKAIDIFDWVRRNVPWTVAAHGNFGYALNSRARKWLPYPEERERFTLLLDAAEEALNEACALQPGNIGYRQELQNNAAIREMAKALDAKRGKADPKLR